MIPELEKGKRMKERGGDGVGGGGRGAVKEKGLSQHLQNRLGQHRQQCSLDPKSRQEMANRTFKKE